MGNNRITPFIKRLRTNGGTIYTFSSALEDVGLNINERNNVVKISYFALLNIPTVNEPSNLEENKFNVYTAINGAFNQNIDAASVKDGRVLIAESFQNYALNFESNLLNRDEYNPSLNRTVSERVFWKWLKETGAIRWQKDASNNWVEEINGDYSKVVKYVGQVSAGNMRIDNFGTYNETYILVPTSHGETKVFFEQINDDNYYHGLIVSEDGGTSSKILGRESYLKPHPDALDFNSHYDYLDSSTIITGTSYNLYYDPSVGSWTPGWWYSQYPNLTTSLNAINRVYVVDSSIYLNTGIFNTDLKYDDNVTQKQFKRSNVDCMSLVWNETRLKEKYNLSVSVSESEMFNSIAIENQVSSEFNFNAALIYYTIYNSTLEEIIETNLLGILFLDAPEGGSANIPNGGIEIPSLEKIASGATGFGTSYSLRLNIKTDNMLDDTQSIIVDKATSDQLYAEDWNDVFYNLQRSVNILSQQNANLNNVYKQYLTIKDNQVQILNDVYSLEKELHDLDATILGEIDVGDVPGDFLTVRTISPGAIVDGSIAGLKVLRADGVNDVILGTGNDAVMRIGWIDDVLQAIATREDEPLEGGYAYWDDTNTIFRTFNLRGYIDASLLRLDASIQQIYDDPPAGDVTKAYVDGSLALRDDSISELDSSVIWLFDNPAVGDVTKEYVDASLAKRDASLEALFEWNDVQDTSISELDSSVIWLFENPAVGDVTKEYVDGSLALRDASLEALFDWQDIQDASSLWDYNDIQDVSIIENAIMIEWLFYNFANVDKDYVDGSLASRDASLEVLFGWNEIQDASIEIKANTSYVDGSLALRDASLGVLFDWNEIQDASIENLSTHQSVQDTSIALKADLSYVDQTFLKESSLGNVFIWDGSLLDVSINAMDYEYVDETFLREASLGDKFIWDASDYLALDIDEMNYEYVDGSLALRDANLNNKLNNTSDTFTGHLIIDGSLDVLGNIYHDGSIYTVSQEELLVEDVFITLRDGAISELADGSIAGIRINIPDGSDNIILGTYNDNTWRIGEEDSSLIAIATREDEPLDGGYAYWDATYSMFKTFDLVDYIDGSIILRDASLEALFEYNDIQDASINDLWSYQSIQDTSISELDSSVIWLFDNPAVGDVTKAYVDASLAKRDASLSVLFDWNNNQDTSIFNISDTLGDLIDYVDTSVAPLAYVDGSLTLRDASLEALFEYNDIQDASINDLWSYQSIQDTSIALKADLSYVDETFLREASLGSKFIWDASDYLALDIDEMNYEYVDGSIILRDASLEALFEYNDIQDASINDLWSYQSIQDTSIALKADLSYVDGSLALRDASLEVLFDWNETQDVSIHNLRIVVSSIQSYVSKIDDRFATRDASIVDLREWNEAQDASIENLWNYNDIQDASLALKSDITYVDGSLALRDASLDYLFDWNNIQDTSISNLKIYNITQDSSIDNINTTINWLNNNKQPKSENKSPASNATGTKGDIAYDASYVYICYNTNLWGRSLLEISY